MKRLEWLGRLVLLACLGGTQARAAESAITAQDKGKRLALDTCAACHVVSSDQPDQPMLEPRAPSFVAIANEPGVTANGLRQFVMTVHKTLRTPPNMPTMILSDDESAVIVAYILGLKKQP